MKHCKECCTDWADACPGVTPDDAIKAMLPDGWNIFEFGRVYNSKGKFAHIEKGSQGESRVGWGDDLTSAIKDAVGKIGEPPDEQ